MHERLSRRAALTLFGLVILCWGFNWPVAKVLVQSVSPLWMVSIRSAIALIVLLVLMLATHSLRVPKRGDLPVVFNIALLHMSGFAILMAIGLMHVPAGRSIVLGFTTPLWVIPGAILFLGERVTPMRAVGIALGLGGLLVLFNPLQFDWTDQRALLGNGLLMLAAFCWAISILHLRAHKWISTPYQLVFWEVLVATGVVTVLAAAIEGKPNIPWDAPIVLLFLYGGVFGVALAYWAMAMVNRSLPAVTTSLGVLATPVVGVLSAVFMLGEPFNLGLAIALVMILGGIALGTVGGQRTSSAPDA
jgi:drug/metabolite transporter (DMT)-like permease